MIENGEAENDYSIIYYFLPSIIDWSEEINKYFNNVSVTLIDISQNQLNTWADTDFNLAGLNLFEMNKTIMSNAVIKCLKYMNDVSNSNLARNTHGILSDTEVDIPIDWRDENSHRIPSQELKTSHKYFSDVYLPIEVWFETVKRLTFIDAINFSVTTETFYQLVWENKKYEKVMWLSKFLVNFDEDYFEFIENNLKLLIKKNSNKIQG